MSVANYRFSDVLSLPGGTIVAYCYSQDLLATVGVIPGEIARQVRVSHQIVSD